MRLIRSIVLLCVINVLPLVVLYLLTGGIYRNIFMSLYLITYLLIFYYADKFILLFLGAREIIDADNKALFQVLKSTTFRTYQSLPKVYLYSGDQFKSFVLDSRNEWSIVLDRNLIENADEKQLESMMEFLINLKLSKAAWVQTKGMGLIAVILKLNYWWLENVFMLQKGSKVYRTTCFISLMFIKPILEFINWFTRSNKKIVCSNQMRPLFYDCQQARKIETFSEFLAMHLVESVSYNDLIIDYLESFPVFENCEFNN
jgi:hypothetical protein